MQPFRPEVLAAATRANRHLIVLMVPGVEPIDGFATAEGYQYINVTLELGGLLLPLSPARRRTKVKRLLEEILDATTQACLVLDRIELLFEPGLNVDVPGLLRDLATNRTLIVRFPGTYENGSLVYGDGTHPNSSSISAQGLIVATIPL